MRSSQLLVDFDQLRTRFFELLDWSRRVEGFLVSPELAPECAAELGIQRAGQRLASLVITDTLLDDELPEATRVVSSKHIHAELGGDVWLFESGDERRLLFGAGALCGHGGQPVVATVIAGRRFDAAISAWLRSLRSVRDASVPVETWPTSRTPPAHAPLDATVDRLVPVLEIDAVRRHHSTLEESLDEVATQFNETDSGEHWYATTRWAIGLSSDPYTIAPVVSCALAQPPRFGSPFIVLLDGEVAMTAKHHQPRWYFANKPGNAADTFLVVKPTDDDDTEAFWSRSRYRGARLRLPDGRTERVLVIGEIEAADLAERLAEVTHELVRLLSTNDDDHDDVIDIAPREAWDVIIGLGPMRIVEARERIAAALLDIEKLDEREHAAEFQCITRVLRYGFGHGHFDRPKRRGWIRAVAEDLIDLPDDAWRFLVVETLRACERPMPLTRLAPVLARLLEKNVGLEVSPTARVLERKLELVLDSLVRAGRAAVDDNKRYQLRWRVAEIPEDLWLRAVREVLSGDEPQTRAQLAAETVTRLTAHGVRIVPFHDGALIGEQVDLMLARLAWSHTLSDESLAELV